MSTALHSTSQTTSNPSDPNQVQNLHAEFLQLSATLDSLRSMAYPSQPGAPGTGSSGISGSGMSYPTGTGALPSSLTGRTPMTSGPSSAAAMAAAAAAASATTGVPSAAAATGFSMPNVPSFPISSGLFSTPLAAASGAAPPMTPGSSVSGLGLSGGGFSAKGAAISPLMQTPMDSMSGRSASAVTGPVSTSIPTSVSVAAAAAAATSSSSATGEGSSEMTQDPSGSGGASGSSSAGLTNGQVFAPMMHPVFGPVLAPLDGSSSSSMTGGVSTLSKSSSLPTAMGWPASSSSFPMDQFHSAPFFSVGSSVGSSILSSGGVSTLPTSASAAGMSAMGGFGAGGGSSVGMYGMGVGGSGGSGMMSIPSGISSLSPHSSSAAAAAAYLGHPSVVGQHSSNNNNNNNGNPYSMTATQRRITGITNMGGGIQPVMYQTSLEEQMRAYDRRTAETIRAKQQQRQQLRQQQQQQHGGYHSHRAHHSSYKSDGYHGSGSASGSSSRFHQHTRGDKLALLQRMTEGPRIRIDTSILRSANVRLPDIVTENKIFLKMVSNKFGSKYIQRLADDPLTPLDHIDMLVTALKPHALEIGQNVFGNYVLQKMLELTVERVYFLESQQSRLSSSLMAHHHPMTGADITGGGTKKNIELLREMGNKLMLSIINDNTVELSCDQFGCRVLQRILKYNHSDHPDILNAKKQILNEVISTDKTMHILIMDEFGNHVIQKCIENIPSEDLITLTNNICDNCLEYSCHVYGCRVVQRVLTNCSPTQTSGIFSAVLANIHVLCGDEYGNYVVQHSVNCAHDLTWLSDITGYLSRFSASLVGQKYSANVIEKVIPMLSADLRAKIFDGILSKRVTVSVGDSSSVSIKMSDDTLMQSEDVIPGEDDHKVIEDASKTDATTPTKPPLSLSLKSLSVSTPTSGSAAAASSSGVVVSELTGAKTKTVTLVSDMVYSAFGNYVVQSMLDNCNQEYYEKICTEIGRDLNHDRLKMLQWGKFVLQKMGYTTRSK